jgi:hypothetical protein
MLVELRRQLDEIAGDAGAGNQGIFDIRQHAVQAMAEFVEQRARIIETEQRRTALRGLGKIHHVDDDRPDIAVEFLLRAEAGHPGAAAFGGAREIIAKKEGDMLAAAIADIEGANVGMVERQAVDFAELQSEQLRRGVERRVDHFVELQIGL